jgi:hypothetical protein
LDELNKVTEVFEDASKPQPKDEGDIIQQTINDLEGDIKRLREELYGEVEAAPGLVDQALIDEILAEIDEKQKYIDKLLGRRGQRSKRQRLLKT